MTTFVGIDPGVSGGIAIMNTGIIEMHSFRDMTLQDTVALFDRLFGSPTRNATLRVMLERVHAMPSHIRGCMTSWILCESFMMIKTLLTVHEVPWEMVLPEKWQMEIGVRIKKSKVKVDKKKINREKAQALFPRLAGITLDTADAVLIAEYARRTHR